MLRGVDGQALDLKGRGKRPSGRRARVGDAGDEVEDGAEIEVFRSDSPRDEAMLLAGDVKVVHPDIAVEQRAVDLEEAIPPAPPSGIRIDDNLCQSMFAPV